jgi:hypothetical protein
MKDEEILLVAGLVLFMLMRKKATAPMISAGVRSAPVDNKNVNNQLWTALLGTAWSGIVTAKNSAGNTVFPVNSRGDMVNSAGIPLDAGNRVTAQDSASYASESYADSFSNDVNAWDL